MIRKETVFRRFWYEYEFLGYFHYLHYSGADRPGDTSLQKGPQQQLLRDRLQQLQRLQ